MVLGQISFLLGYVATIKSEIVLYIMHIGAIKSSRKYIFMSCQIPIRPASDMFTVRLCAEKLAIFTLTFPKPVNIKRGFGQPLFMLDHNVNECSFSSIHIEGARIAPCKIVFLSWNMYCVMADEYEDSFTGEKRFDRMFESKAEPGYFPLLI